MVDEISLVNERIASCNSPEDTENDPTGSWKKQNYTPKDALVFRNETGVIIAPYLGQDFDPERAEVKAGCWDHDYCEDCGQLLFRSGDPKHGIGYTDGRAWVCLECFQERLEPQLS